MLGKEERPDETYQDIGGMHDQKQEIREAQAVELPLTHFDLNKKIGIDPPGGVLLYGQPGTGKTMLVGSEFVQKYLGEVPRIVRDVFRRARENAPAIIFVNLDAQTKCCGFSLSSGADREVERILLKLLNQMDGFDQGSNVKVIMATNREDNLDLALSSSTSPDHDERSVSSSRRLRIR